MDMRPWRWDPAVHKAVASFMKATSSVETGQQVNNLISDWGKSGAETRGGPGEESREPDYLGQGSVPEGFSQELALEQTPEWSK